MSSVRAGSGSVGSIPDEYLECIRMRRHVIVRSREHKQRVRIRYDTTRHGEVIDAIEYDGVCELCETRRVQLRTDDHLDEFLSAEYHYPDGYLAPSGAPYDRAEVIAEYRRRNPVGGSRVVRVR